MMGENEMLRLEQNNSEFMKYKNIFANHMLRIEQQEEKNKIFLCHCEEKFEVWYRVVFEPFRIILHGDFDHFILRVDEKDTLKWLLNICNSEIDFNNILKKIPCEYIEFSPLKAKLLLDKLENNLKDILSDHILIRNKDSFYYHEKNSIKVDLDIIKFDIRDLKKELKEINNKEFCEGYNGIIKRYDYQLGSIIHENNVNKYTSKCYLNLAALFKFSELYCEKYFNNLVAV